MNERRSFWDRLLLEVEKGGDLADRTAALDALLIELQRRLGDAHDAAPDFGGTIDDYDECQRIVEALTDAGLLAASIREWLQPFGASPIRLELKHRLGETEGKQRTGGKPVDWPAKRRRALENNRAARLLEIRSSQRGDQEGCILDIEDELGIPRDRIFKGKKLRVAIKTARPGITERELEEEIMFDPDGHHYFQVSRLLGE